MCGIAGFLVSAASNAANMHGIATRMAQTLQHRGPDDSAVWSDSEAGIVLAHRRLAIQDLSPNGRQPMRSQSGRYCITFNGELYNFLALSGELRRLGQNFQGHSDTEVLLAAVDVWGLAAAIQRFVGMFAFAIWDRETKVLHLVRDRLGEKPIYYGWLDGTFVFVSELKALRSYPGWTADINRDALALHMRYGYVPTPFSIYTGIYKLPPGTILSIDARTPRSRQLFSPHVDTDALGEPSVCPHSYWSLRKTAGEGVARPIRTEEYAIQELDRLLHQAVRGQVVSDVPIGAFLSGGIDSSTVVAVMQSETSNPVKTFTIGFHEKDYNEAEYANRIAAHLGTQHTELYVTPDDALKVVPSLATIYDEPFSDSSQIPAYLVSKMAREHVTVCLSGDGGDELFAGYNRYFWTEKLYKSTRFMPQWFKKSISSALTVFPPSFWECMFSVGTRSMRSQPAVGLKLQKLAHLLQEKDVVNMYQRLVSYWDDPTSLVLNSNDTPTTVNKDNIIDNCADFIHQAMYWDLLSYLPDDNLTKVDRASMAVSLETRLPLLDHRIVEFAWRVPLSMKMRGMQKKWLLQQVLRKYVPRDLFERPKMGFSVPVGDWLRGPLRDWAEDLLNESRLSQEGYFDVQLVRQKWAEHVSGKRNWQLPIWGVLMFQAWHRASR